MAGEVIVRFLIDGYNLMHAAGVVGHRKVNHLKPARRRFLDWLADATRVRADTLRVVFDGQTAPADTGEEIHRGVQVRFAFRATADDAIEEELAHTGRGGWVVVSDDTRLHEAARRRGCEAWRCAKFMDRLIELPKGTDATVVEEEKPVSGCVDEQLLMAFALPGPSNRMDTSSAGSDRGITVLQKVDLDSRLARHLTDPDAASGWEEVEARLLAGGRVEKIT